ncbi:uncharacterized protein DUF3152 [Kitasatospora sp. SolWspMP-SS2h]|uniref:DUF3152 domain-containing protein n=1 Tax=Kitasatospora sp. SolWspMP-SS2h TaxID=1305729 RepID=UPI000DB8FF46|nr:DUF3152 domain-containing protein [Kitasatospora sp. SolWspMP-SS2h]RAJ31163.1 uncharacterized protein DUF3152 [Kitasatospora sp. SolWspMP-SS2h]
MRAAHRTPRRRARRRPALALGCATALAVLGTAGYAALRLDFRQHPAGTATAQARAAPPPASSPGSPAPSTPPPAADPPPADPPPTGAPPSSGPPSSTPPEIVVHGGGVFTTATATGGRAGTGATLRRYRVEVEDGIGIDPNAAAATVQAILSDPRGWTADRRDSFQLVSSDSYDFTVKIASPDTADAVCATGGLDTRGEVNCDVGKQVVVNSKRWLTGSPQFDGALDDYRALIVNHEVGHRIGHGHQACPGPGRPAPAMMQQIYGLKGCVANAWPYDARGTYLDGPPAP